MKTKNKTSNCHAEFVNRLAFTLAEVLIALAIIGVVAALTIPTLMNKYQQRVTVVRLRQAYSMFSEAYKYATIDNGDIVYWDIGTSNTKAGSEKLYNIFKPYLKKVRDCGLKTGCFADNYTTINNDPFVWKPNTHSVYARAVLINNVAFIIWSNGSGCNNDMCGYIWVDINGNQLPNQAGNDFFGFYITTNGIKPFNGSRKLDDYCVLTSNPSRKVNGIGCTSLVLDKCNLDYLKNIKK